MLIFSNYIKNEIRQYLLYSIDYSSLKKINFYNDKKIKKENSR